MKISYGRDEDIVILEIAKDRIDFAEEMGPIIVHFAKSGKPLLLEILDASDFLAMATKSTMKARNNEFMELSF